MANYETFDVYSDGHYICTTELPDTNDIVVTVQREFPDYDNLHVRKWVDGKVPKVTNST